MLNLIGCIDDEPFAYFEAYWTKEDRIAPYYFCQRIKRSRSASISSMRNDTQALMPWS